MSAVESHHRYLVYKVLLLAGLLAGIIIVVQMIDRYVYSFSVVDTLSSNQIVTIVATTSDLVVPSEPSGDEEQARVQAQETQRYKTEYATRLIQLAHNDLAALLATSTQTVFSTTTGTSTIMQAAIPAQELYAEHTALYPAQRTYPATGAILPFRRIVAYYGNFLDTRMGALGEYPPEEMKRRLLQEVANWEAADPDTPVIPAIDYVAMVAQADAGSDGMYRRMMPESEINKALELARSIEGILILEVQPGLSDLQVQIERFEPWLVEPDVHIAIDPEFVMHNGAPPGTVIGSVDANDVNQATAYLKQLADEHNLPPKVLLVHRFTQNMVQNATGITPNDKVQVVMVMDGWGPPGNKINTYDQILAPEPVEFTGFKIFYKNDLKPPSTALLTPAQILDLSPKPIFIQYQ